MNKKSKSVKPVKSKKTNLTNSTLDELIKGHIQLFQICNDLSAKVFANEIAAQKLQGKMQNMEKENLDLRRILELIGEKLKEIKDDMMGGDEDDENSEDSNAPKNIQENKGKQISSIRNTPLHDDVTVPCEVCNKVFHANLKKCPNCGFNRVEGR